MISGLLCVYLVQHDLISNPSICRGQGGFTPLIISAAEGHSEIVDLLCQRGANIEARNNVSSGSNNAMYVCVINMTNSSFINICDACRREKYVCI